MIPESFKALPLELPPMLLDLVGWQGEARFLAFYYAGSKATVTDGRGLKTFSFYSVWTPWIDHVLMALPLIGCDLGTDDSEPTHCLIADTLEKRLHVSPWSDGLQFCEGQHPPLQPLSEDERTALEAAVKEQIAAMQSMSLDELRRLGMFEAFLPASREQTKGCKRLLQWLDRQVTEESLKPYMVMLDRVDEETKRQILKIIEWAAIS